MRKGKKKIGCDPLSKSDLKFEWILEEACLQGQHTGNEVSALLVRYCPQKILI